VALFSLFGKKKQPSKNQAGGKDVSTGEPQQEAAPTPVDDAAEREATNSRMHRDIARMTAEKIDAIESEITRDILKAPTPTETGTSTVPKSEAKPAVDESQSSNLFHTTLVRVDKETMILFREDMDE
jgi:hypothetical protein